MWKIICCCQLVCLLHTLTWCYLSVVKRQRYIVWIQLWGYPLGLHPSPQKGSHSVRLEKRELQKLVLEQLSTWAQNGMMGYAPSTIVCKHTTRVSFLKHANSLVALFWIQQKRRLKQQSIPPLWSLQEKQQLLNQYNASVVHKMNQSNYIDHWIYFCMCFIDPNSQHTYFNQLG